MNKIIETENACLSITLLHEWFTKLNELQSSIFDVYQMLVDVTYLQFAYVILYTARRLSMAKKQMVGIISI